MQIDRQRIGITPLLALVIASSLSTLSHAAGFTGTVTDEKGQPIVGAMVTTRFHQSGVNVEVFGVCILADQILPGDCRQLT